MSTDGPPGGEKKKYGYGTEYQEKLIEKMLRGEKLSDAEFLRLDPNDPRNVPKKHIIDPDGTGKFATEVKFRSGIPPPEMPMMMLKMPSMLPELCKHKWTSMDHPMNRKLHVEPMLGVKIDLINDDKISNTENKEPLHPDDVKLMDMCKHLLGDEFDDIVGPRYFEAKGMPVPEKKKKEEDYVEKKTIVKTEEAKHRDEASKDASWLKNTSYLSNNLSGQVHAFKSDVQEKHKEETLRIVEKYDADDDAATAAIRRAEASFDLVKKKDIKAVAWEVPVFPEHTSMDGILVSFDDEPDDGPVNNEVPSRLISHVENTKIKRKGQNVLAAALSVKKKQTDTGVVSYDWKRQYQARVIQDGAERLALTIGDSAATYQTMTGHRLDLDKCRMPETARGDDDAKVDGWTGETQVIYHDVPAFGAKERNELRAKRRIVDVDVSDDEDEPIEEEEDEEAPPEAEETSAAPPPADAPTHPEDLFGSDDDDDVPPVPDPPTTADPTPMETDDTAEKAATTKRQMEDLFGDDDDDDD